MKIIWMLFSTIEVGLIIFIYNDFFSANGKPKTPKLLTKDVRKITYLLIAVGGYALYREYLISQDYKIFLINLISTIFIGESLFKKTYKPELWLNYFDNDGFLFSEKGLRFGYLKTQTFLDTTMEIRDLSSVEIEIDRLKIVGESFYLLYWPKMLSEISFFVGLFFLNSILLALCFFVIAFLIGFVQIVFSKPKIIFSYIVAKWGIIKYPIFLLSICFLFLYGFGKLAIYLTIFLTLHVLIYAFFLALFNFLIQKLVVRKTGITMNFETVIIIMVINQHRKEHHLNEIPFFTIFD